MEQQLSALQLSVERLRGLVAGLSDRQLEQQAYPTEWCIADVMSHLGSGAVIMARRLDDGLAGKATPDDFAPLVWSEWNAKSRRDKTHDSMTADRVLIDRLQALTDEQQQRFEASFGPFTVDITQFVGLRLNEHTLHTWDIEVALEPSATLHREQTELVVDNLELIAGFAGKPTGSTRTVRVRTTEPEREFAVALDPESATLGAAAGDAATADLELPAEAFVRLIYGRLDPEHAPTVIGDESALDELRAVFRGL